MKFGRYYVFILLLFLSFVLSGCSDNFWDPTQVGRFRPVPSVNVILNSLGVAEETPFAWEGAEGGPVISVAARHKDLRMFFESGQNFL